MAKASSDEPRVEKHKVEGRTVEIRKRGDAEELWIDGVRHRFFVNADGYRLHENAYAPPTKTLLDAARAYLERLQRERKTGRS